MDKGRIALMVMGVVALFLVIGAAVYVSNKLETIEDQLRFADPSERQQGDETAAVVDAEERQAVYVPVYSHVYSVLPSRYVFVSRRVYSCML